MQQSKSLTEARSHAGANAGVLFLERVNEFGYLLRPLIDAGLLFLAFWIAHLARYRFNVGGAVRVVDWQPFTEFLPRAALFVILVMIAFLARGVYSLPRETSILDEGVAVGSGVTIAMAGVILTAYFGQFAFSRLVFIIAWVTAISLLMLRRLATRWMRYQLWQRDIAVERILVVGGGEAGRRLMQALMGNSVHGYRVVGFLDDASDATLSFGTESGVQRAVRLGCPADVAAVVERLRVDDVFIALPAADHDRILKVIELCRRQVVSFKLVPDLLQLSMDRVDVSDVAGLPLIGIKDASIRGGRYLVKRSMDLVIASTIFLLSALPMAIIALVIKRGSAGPVIYRQTRVGKDGRLFTLFKFRCMVEEADLLRAELMGAHDQRDPLLFKLEDDPRVTPAGRWLRRWSLDELPQLYNVLRSEMSLVGPRPQLPEEVEGYEDWHRQRLLVAPGVTGLWQVNGRSRLTFDDMVRLDLYYAEHWSPWLDFKIMLRTIPAVLTRRGAY